MPVPLETRAQIRRRIGALAYSRQYFLYDTVLTSTAAGASMTFGKRGIPDDALKGHNIYDPISGQQRRVLSNTEATGTITNSGFGRTPASGDTIEVWPADVDPTTVNDLIVAAINRASDMSLVYDEAVPTLDSTRMIVTLPTTMKRVSGFQYFYNGQLYTYDFRDIPDPMIDSWTLRGRKLYLSSAVISAATDILAQGYRLPTTTLTDATTVEVNPSFVMYYVAYMLEAGDAASPGYDPDASAPRAQVWLREAMQIYSTMPTAWQSNTRELPL
jgi:hypothetical protein